MTTLTFTVNRWTHFSRFGVGSAMFAVLCLAVLPTLVTSGTTDRLVAFFVYVLLAAMWNALSGFGGLVSIGQQMFFGLGAYATIRLSNFGLDPYLSVIASGFLVAAVAVPVSRFMLHLKGGEFAIGMWVLASLTHMLVNLDPLIQGETGISLIALNGYEAGTRALITYLLALFATCAIMAGLFHLLRTRTGAAIRAIRDSDEAAQSLGVDILATKRQLFVLAAFGTAVAGALWLASATTFQPKTYFSVQWTAYMIFMVLVGGIATFEGAILGAIIFFLFETWFGGSGVWYLIALGAAAVLFSLFFPKGVWGAIAARLPDTLLPLGYRLQLGSKEQTAQANTSGAAELAKERS